MAASTGRPQGTQLAAVRIAAADVDGAADVIAKICGGAVDVDGEARHVRVGDVALVVEPSGDGGPSGIVAVEFAGVAGAATQSILNGVHVTTTPGTTTGELGPADVFVDHVAILVHDLDASADAWEAATGVAAELIGIHPISNGTLAAARLAVGDRMIELISPVPGMSSPAASRLERHGEGPMALAIPALNLDTKLAELRAEGIRLLEQPPHWLVHPANPTGVLFQLTPRVKH